MECSSKTCQQRGEKYVCHERHDRDVHVWRVQIVSRGKEVVRVRCVRRAGVLNCRGGSLFSGPRLMPPREEDKEDLSQDVGGGDVEVVF